jgi:hypothetical protein
MRTARLRLCLSVSLVFPALSLASLEYTVKHDAEVYRTEALEPPPMASLSEGQAVRLIHQGPEGSLIETGTGLKGWIRNGDLLALAPATGGDHRLGDQQVMGGGELNVSPLTLKLRFNPDADVILDRGFAGEILETVDKEQVEMRHDEN